MPSHDEITRVCPWCKQRFYGTAAACLRCYVRAIDPEARPTSQEEAADALHEYLHGGSLEAACPDDYLEAV